jgi:hypothetical protein
MRYTTLDAVLNYIPRAIRHEEDNDMLLKSWMLQGLKLLNLSQQYSAEVGYFKVENNKTQLPDNLYKIEYIGLCNDKTIDEDTFSLCAIEESVEEEDEETVPEENGCKLPIYYRMFLDTVFSTAKYPAMQYLYNVSADYLLCKDCICRCVTAPYQFTISKELVLTTNLENGTIVILYKSPVMDKDGNYLVPDTERVKQALAAYASAIHWENRDAVHESGSGGRYDRKLFEADRKMRAAKGDSILRMLNADKISQLVKSKTFQYGSYPV